MCSKRSINQTIALRIGRKKIIIDLRYIIAMMDVILYCKFAWVEQHGSKELRSEEWLKIGEKVQC